MSSQDRNSSEQDPSEQDTMKIRIRSDPPEVKMSRDRNDSLVDAFTIASLTLLLVSKSCPPGWDVYAIGAIILIGGGAQILQALGKRGGGVTMLAIGLIPMLLKALVQKPF